jgi:hypothetical protein
MRSLTLLAIASMVVGCGGGIDHITASTGAKACATISSCGVGGVTSCTRFITSVNNDSTAPLTHFSASEVSCLASAGADCDAARRCLNGGKTPSPCTGASNSCSGNVLISCSPLGGSNGTSGTIQFDCGAYGQMCVANNNRIDCGFGSCSGLSAQCVGNVLQTCDGSIVHQVDCSQYSAVCVSSGIPSCRGVGAACDKGQANGSIRCDGNTLVICADGQEARFSCGSIEEGCFPNADGTGFGCAAGGDCTPTSFSPTCTGTTLHFCNNGKSDTLDCASIGFHGCSADNGGKCTM